MELANSAAAGRGGIDFASTTGKIEYAGAGADLANTISGFGGKDRIGFALVSFAPGDHAVDKAGKVSIKTSAGVTVATFNVSGTYTSANFHVGKDASGHVLVTFVGGAAAAAIDEVRGEARRIFWRVPLGVCGAVMDADQRQVCVRFLGSACVERRDRSRLPP